MVDHNAISKVEDLQAAAKGKITVIKLRVETLLCERYLKEAAKRKEVIKKREPFLTLKQTSQNIRGASRPPACSIKNVCRFVSATLL